jgi:hypothetical protein
VQELRCSKCERRLSTKISALSASAGAPDKKSSRHIKVDSSIFLLTANFFNQQPQSNCEFISASLLSRDK